jgi:hypothetical protein
MTLEPIAQENSYEIEKGVVLTETYEEGYLVGISIELDSDDGQLTPNKIKTIISNFYAGK